MSTAAVFVPGRPAPQGSKLARPIYKGRGDAKEFTGKVAQVESSKPGLEVWRADVRAAFLTDDNQPRFRFAKGQPVSVRLTFVMPRPVGMSRRKPTPPHTKRPDVDKLLRAVLDALTSAGVLADDCQVVEQYAAKRTADPDETPGCLIHVQPTVDEPGPLPQALRIVLALHRHRAWNAYSRLVDDLGQVELKFGYHCMECGDTRDQLCRTVRSVAESLNVNEFDLLTAARERPCP